MDGKKIHRLTTYDADGNFDSESTLAEEISDAMIAAITNEFGFGLMNYRGIFIKRLASHFKT